MITIYTHIDDANERFPTGVGSTTPMHSCVSRHGLARLMFVMKQSFDPLDLPLAMCSLLVCYYNSVHIIQLPPVVVATSPSRASTTVVALKAEDEAIGSNNSSMRRSSKSSISNNSNNSNNIDIGMQ